MKLISLRDFVLEQSMSKETILNRFTKIQNYANFLSQPLTLGMFVPCVDNVPLEEPNFKNTRNSDLHFLATETYNKAKENVLFEGFEYNGHSKDCFILEYKDGTYWLNSEDTIEGLIENFTEPLTLTESAKQQLK